MKNRVLTRQTPEIILSRILKGEPREKRNLSSLKAVFFARCGKSLLEVRQVRLRKPLPQLPKKYGFKVRSILTTINSGKSRQTSEVILDRITSEFNKDFTNFAPLKLNDVRFSLG